MTGQTAPSTPDAPQQQAAAYCVHELITRQAAATPDAIAVAGPSVRLSYAQLDHRANQLAHYLRSRGLGPESLAGVCMHRDAELIVTLLAVLKAGGAYLPLDPEDPVGRLEFLLKDTGAAAVITEPSLASQLSGADVPVLTLDQAAAGPASLPPQTGVTPDNLLYALYTSGSTGRPKGVLVTHRGMANRILWAARHHGLGPSDVVLQKTPLTFDAAGWEVFATLGNGGTVVVPEHGAERDPAAIVRAVTGHGATVLQMVPSMLRLLAAEPGFPACTSLRAVFSGGEPLTDELCALVRKRIDADIYNLYGVSECTIDSTCWRYRPGERVAIGAPVDNVRAYVLDHDFDPVPTGVAGELCIAGAGVGRGYLGRPALTAERFVPGQFGGSGERLYRTGDRARWRADGTLEFLGRIDDQVKVAGIRIEPGEVEAALSGQPGVTAVAVTARPDTHGDLQLVAYVEPADADASALRALAATRLPRGLVPSRFVTLDQLPRTSSGKIDRRALPDPEPVAQPGAQLRVPPRTPTERRVAKVIARALGVDQVGVHDDFFELGGNSLLAIKTAGELRAALGVTVPPREFYQAPTVEQLAACADAAGAAVSARIRPVSRESHLPAAYGQRRLWFLDQLAGQLDYLITVPLRLRGPLDVQALETAIRDLVARHEALRTRCCQRGGELVQVIGPPDSAGLVHADLGDRSVQEFVAGVSATPVELEADMPFRSYLGRVNDDDHVLVLSVHHIACDGWSMNIIARELRELYLAAVTGRPAALTPPAIQFADYAAWQRDWLAGPDAAAQLDYWRDRLADLAPAELPTDRPRSARRDSSGSCFDFEVPAEIAQPVLEAGRAQGATPFMTMLTPLMMLVALEAGRTDVAVGTTVTARTRPETEDLVGFLMNSVTLRTDVSGRATFGELVSRVRDTALGAFANQDLPFDQLVDKLHPARHPARNPLFQVLFEMDNLAGRSFSLPGVTADPLPVGWAAAKLELMFHLAGQRDGSYAGRVVYPTALFDRGTVERLAGRYTQLLEQIAGQPSLAWELTGPGGEPGQQNSGRPDRAQADRYQVARRADSAPATATEEAIAAVWSEVLGIGQAGPADDFFDLGGHSLLAAEVNLRLRDEFDIDLPLHVLFQATTLAGLAGVVERAVHEDIERLSDADIEAIIRG
jgi:amino acid adenylation domain-containing protein